MEFFSRREVGWSLWKDGTKAGAERPCGRSATVGVNGFAPISFHGLVTVNVFESVSKYTPLRYCKRVNEPWLPSLKFNV